MDKLERQVRRAQRRLRRQRFLENLGWTCTATLSAAVAVVLADRFWPLGVAPWAWAGGAVVVGFVAAWIWTLATSPEPIDAALEIDRRFSLKERVSSTLALSPEEREEPAGAALVNDATRRVERINVAERIRVRPPRRLLYPLIPAALALAILALVAPAKPTGAAQAKTKQAQVQKQVKKSTKKLERRLAQQHKKAEKQGLQEIKNVLKLLQQDLKKLEQSPPGDRKEALAKLNDLARQLRERREQFSEAERLRNQLQQLKNVKQGPADRLAKAMKQGDFGKAAEELQKIQQQMKSNKLDAEQRRKLAEQLNQMADKLKKAAEAHDQMQQKLQSEIDRMRNAGNTEQANKLEEQLAKLRDQMPQSDLLDKMAQQMKECSECCNQGKLSEAQNAMQQLADNLKGMEQDMQQLEMLDEAAQQMAQCRGEMAGFDPDDPGNVAVHDPRAMPGGLKAGEGHVPGGVRGDEPETAFHDSQVRGNVGKGAMKMGGYLDGPNRKGEVGEAIMEEVDAVRHGQTDPLTDQQMPRRHREHAQEYLERLREGK